MMRLVLAVAVFALAGAAQAAPVPKFKNRTSYSEARETLLGLGWQPVHHPEADECYKEDERCQGRPEMFKCAGTGLGNCLFLWRKDTTLIEVGTVGEGVSRVTGVRCRSSCR